MRGYCLFYCKTFFLAPDSTECTIFFLPKSAVYYLYHLKSNNFIGQREIIQKNHFSMIGFAELRTFFCIAYSCKAKIFSTNCTNIYFTNWLRVISCQEQINGQLVVIHHQNMQKLTSIRFLKLNL